METVGLAYVEICVSNEKSALEYFVDSLGFTVIAESFDELRRSTLLDGGGQLMITAPSAPGQLSEHLDEHGDGVIDVAMRCSDVHATAERAIGAGLHSLGRRDGFPVVEGFGTIQHTLVPATSGGLSGLPGSWRPVGPLRSTRVRRLDHLAGVLLPGELQAMVNTYCAAFGMYRYSAEYVEVGKQAMDSIVIRGDADLTLTMIEPDANREPGQLDNFLERNGGGGVQHIALLVDDIVEAVREFSSRGVSFLETPRTYYDALISRVGYLDEKLDDLRSANVLADRDEWGYLLQIFTRSPYARNTLFYELIQRHEARGFGINNIRALYESVESSTPTPTQR